MTLDGIHPPLLITVIYYLTREDIQCHRTLVIGKTATQIEMCHCSWTHDQALDTTSDPVYNFEVRRSPKEKLYHVTLWLWLGHIVAIDFVTLCSKHWSRWPLICPSPASEIESPAVFCLHKSNTWTHRGNLVANFNYIPAFVPSQINDIDLLLRRRTSRLGECVYLW